MSNQISIGISDAKALVSLLYQFLEECGYKLPHYYHSELTKTVDILSLKLSKNHGESHG